MPDQNQEQNQEQNNEFLSQEELDALLKGLQEDEEEETEEKSEPIGISLTNEEIDAIGEVSNVSMGSAATALSTMLGKKVIITTPSVLLKSLDDLKKDYSGKMICVTVEYTEGIKGISLLMIEPEAVGIIADLMMGGTGKASGQLDDITMSAAGEAMNQMMGSSATTLSDFFGIKITIAPPKVQLLDFDDPNLEFPPISTDSSSPVVIVKFKMNIESLISTEVLQIFDVSLSKQLTKMFFEKTLGAQETTITSKQNEVVPTTKRVPEESLEIGFDTTESSKPKIKAQPVELPEFEEESFETEEKTVGSERLKLLYDIPLEISVELGRTKMTLKQILELDKGSLIELDKLTGEYADILVNGKIIARGEVVVIGENFGVRITEIISPRERLYSLK